MFTSAAKNFPLERENRKGLKDQLLKFGVSFLDDSLLGIRPDDLVLVGAPSGVGKTQFCVNLALANLADGKRVHFFALEAGVNEIERRLKFQVLAHNFYGDPNRPKLGRPLLFDEWEVGEYEGLLTEYEDWAEKYCVASFGGLHTFYKTETFDVAKLIELTSYVSEETDLIIVDHVHYFDWDDQNDNRAIKEIAKAARDLCLVGKKPIVLVAHLRKRDKKHSELVADLDEFHGSSDLTKIATKVITLASGGPAPEGGFYTYLRTPKNRNSSSSSRYLAKIVFDEKKGTYESTYKIGWANAHTFGEIEMGKIPSWVGRSNRRGSGGLSGANASGHTKPYERQARDGFISRSFKESEGD